MKEILYVFMGGGAGSAVRYIIGVSSKKLMPAVSFPLHTLIANLVACTIFALVMVYGKDKLTPATQTLLLAGFCGGLSTFSAFSFETYGLLTINPAWAIVNILISVLGCIGVFYLIR